MQHTSLVKRAMRNKAVPLLLILIVFMILTMIISSGVLNGGPVSAMFTTGFLSSGNLLGIFYKLVMQMVMMCGIALILLGGNIDLSVASQAALGAMVFGIICRDTQLHWIFALLIALLLGACFGLVNTFLVNKLRFPSFIATIGMASVYRGLCNVLTQGMNVQINRAGFLDMATTNVWIFPATFLFALLLIIVYQFILSRTTFGRSIFMAGGNAHAARLSGLNTAKIRMILFINNGVLAVLGGLLWSAQLKQASPTAIIADGPDVTVISASILGGISFMGGAGNLGGPLVAIILLNVFENMMLVLKMESYWTIFVQGALLVLALIIDYFSEQRRRRALLAAAAGAR